MKKENKPNYGINMHQEISLREMKCCMSVIFTNKPVSIRKISPTNGRTELTSSDHHLNKFDWTGLKLCKREKAVI